MIDSFYFILKLNEDPVKFTEICAKIKTKLEVSGLTYIDDYDVTNKNTLFICIGGDGTAIFGSKMAMQKGAFVLSIHAGNLGFLTAFSLPELEDFMGDGNTSLIKHIEQCKIVKRGFLEYEAGDKTSYALNEFNLSGEQSDELINISLKIDGVNAGIHKANGVMVSTPTGSTAYSLFTGGCILIPTAENMQITFVAPMTLSARPIVVPWKSIVELTILSDKDHTVLKCDGMKTSFNKSKSIHLTGSNKQADFLVKKDWSFFDLISQKLNWNQKGY